METGARVWLRSPHSEWGWVPALISDREEIVALAKGRLGSTYEKKSLRLTVTNDSNDEFGNYFDRVPQFEVQIVVDAKNKECEEVKLRNLGDDDAESGLNSSMKSSPKSEGEPIGLVNDLIHLTHLHEPAILHSLRLRYDGDVIYTSTGPILIAINPFKMMEGLYGEEVMEMYRRCGEGTGTPLLHATPYKQSKTTPNSPSPKALPPHAYKTADEAYRSMMRGLENSVIMKSASKKSSAKARIGTKSLQADTTGALPANQSILVSGESGAGKTVTTKIVLNYFAMLSKKITSDEFARRRETFSPVSSPKHLPSSPNAEREEVCIEQQVLQSNPILESFGNARTLRNDNSSRFGKYIDIRFTNKGKLSGASIETYLLEKVRLIHPSEGERNYHVFYQFLSRASNEEKRQFMMEGLGVKDFALLSETGTYDRRDGVDDGEMHEEMLEAMMTIGFSDETVYSLMRLIAAILHCGNMTFTARHLTNSRGHSDACSLDKTHSAIAAANLLGVTFEDLSSALTSRAIRAGNEVVHSPMDIIQSQKACEALMKATYGAAFDFIVAKVNESISARQTKPQASNTCASIGVLDIFGFETFESNNFEQICINYTNEALQQQFNKYVFKLEQDEYEREGILWKFISFPDNQEVLDLIDKKHSGILALLDEQCIVPQSTDKKFTRYLYAKCDRHNRFSASAAQRVDYKFSIDHYAGPVEYSTDNWLEKNKDQMPSASVELVKGANFELLGQIQKYIRSEDRDGRGSVATKSVGAQFSIQLRELRSRIDTTVPHYIRCLKPNDELVADCFDPKMIVDQLRCGGVLEAVRVSRAGYPTRYPHEVFKARYYVLGDSKDTTMTSPYGNKNRASMDQEDMEIKKLISKIAFDIWEADHEAMMAGNETNLTPVKQTRGKSPPRTMNGHMNLVVVSTAFTPEDERKKKERAKKLRQSEQHTTGMVTPQTPKEFLALDFSSRCAVAGLQLGRTKVFLRREAFDRIEALRAQKFGASAVAIQKIVRGVQARKYCAEKYNAVLTIQRAARCCLAVLYEKQMDYMNFAAVIIQRAYRHHLNHMFYVELDRRLIPAATKIQSVARGANTRMWYFGTLYSVMRLQALVRGFLARAVVAKFIVERHQPVSSPIGSIGSAPSFEGREFNGISITKQLVPAEECQAVVAVDGDWDVLKKLVHDENWAGVEGLLDNNPNLAGHTDSDNGEMLLHMLSRHPSVWSLLVDMVLVMYPKALIHKDSIGALPLHHASAHDNIGAIEIIYSAYKEGVNDIDGNGRQSIHVAAEFDATEAVKFLLAKAPEGAFTMIHHPSEENGGGLPLHVACRHHSNMSIITTLLAENFSSAKRADENGDLPLHLLLRNGEVVEQVTVKTLLTCFASAVTRTDKNGDLPLSIAIKNECKPSVVNYLMVQYPDAAKALGGIGHSNLHLALQHGADDRTMLGLLNHAPELATLIDKESGMLPIQMATEYEHSHFIVHHLLKADLPINIKEKVKAEVQDHHFSWNHIVSNTDDLYYPVVNKILQQCTQPQVLALAHVEGPDGRIALSTATPVCKHEMRVMLRLFNTLEVVNQRPAFSNPQSDTQIFYALRYDPPKADNGQWSLIHEDNKKDGDYLDEWDDSSHVSGLSRMSSHSSQSLSSKCSQVTIDKKMKQIKKEKGQQVIAKLTSRSDIVERELKIRKDFNLSRHYVPAVISVHHTVQHAAYSEAMAEPGYCITMEGADTTAENLMLDMRRHGKSFSTKILKRIGISLLHMHEHGLVHGDFGTHNIGKFGSRWKLLGVGGSKAIGSPTDPKRGFYHPPESVVVESKRAPLGKKEVIAKVISISARPSHDIWAFGVLMYEAICGVPLSPYACRGKRPMNANEVAKIGRWDEMALARALRHVDPSDNNAFDILQRLLHHNPSQRSNSLRVILEHPFFSGSPEDRILKPRETSDARSTRSGLTSASYQSGQAPNELHHIAAKNLQLSEGLRRLDQENAMNGIPLPRGVNKKVKGSGESVVSHRSQGSAMSQKMKGLRDRVKGFASRKQAI